MILPFFTRFLITCSLVQQDLNSQTISLEMNTQPFSQTVVSSKEFLDIQATIECRFTLKGVCDMIRTRIHVSCVTLNKDLESINIWAFQWKMQFNPGQNKQAQELYFSRKAANQKSLDLTFNKNNVVSSSSVENN